MNCAPGRYVITLSMATYKRRVGYSSRRTIATLVFRGNVLTGIIRNKPLSRILVRRFNYNYLESWSMQDSIGTVPHEERRPMPPQRNSSSASDDKLARLLGDLRQLPLLPAVAQRAVAMANDKHATVKEFSTLIENDITLSASILKLANSSSYNWSQAIDTVDQAVARLGFRECQNLIFAASMGNLYKQVDPLTKGRCAVLWQHGFLTACLCRRLNKELRYDFHGEEFTAGLMHDLGRILLAVSFPKDFDAADPMDFIEKEGVREREQAALQTDHCELGGHYAQQNHLPGAAGTSIRFHHNLDEARDYPGILGLVAMSDQMANYLQRGERPEAYDVSKNTGFLFLARSWTTAQKDIFMRRAPELMAQTVNSATEQKKGGPPAPTGPSSQATNEAANKNKPGGNFRSWLGI